MLSQQRKLIALLKELFQLDQPELDFGIYRLMQIRAEELTRFLEHDLIPQIRTSLTRLYSNNLIKNQEEQGGKPITGSSATALHAEQHPSADVLEYHHSSPRTPEGIDAAEKEVYDHLYRFFRRYYAAGDIIGKRVYKQGAYAIPYAGEEVVLHWANKEQIYTKTEAYLRDYAFRLKPDSVTEPLRVHFRLTGAAEGEPGNIKETTGQERVFILAKSNFLALEAGELVIRFVYRPAALDDWPEEIRLKKTKPPTQSELITFAVQTIFASASSANHELRIWLDELSKPHILADGKRAGYSQLEAHLRRYTARHTRDYFIHKQLDAFLRRELEFYIKNEMLSLDDLTFSTPERSWHRIVTANATRQIAEKIIDFLTGLENLQRKLWLKKKFVIETSYCLTVNAIPPEFYPEIVANKEQIAEWVQLGFFGGEPGDTPGNNSPTSARPLPPVTSGDLLAHPTLVVDTRHFSPDFTTRLIEALGQRTDLAVQIDGLLVQGENYHALRLLQRSYREAVETIYIDPPYNTGGDGFLYRDQYKDSSWLAMLSDRLSLANSILSPAGSIFVSIDDHEVHLLRLLLEQHFGKDNFIATLAISLNPKGRQLSTYFATSHEYVHVFAKRVEECLLAPVSRDTVNEKDFPLHEGNTRYRLLPFRNTNKRFNPATRPNLSYPLYIDPDSGRVHTEPGRGLLTVMPVFGSGEPAVWRWSKEKVRKQADELVARRVQGSRGERWDVYQKDYLYKGRVKKLNTFWSSTEAGSTDQAVVELKDLGFTFSSPKPTRLISRLVKTMPGDTSVLDFFAGSGTTGHAVINLNRADGGRRKFILVEMGDYFDTILLPRLKKVIFSPEWKDGKPMREATPVEAEYSPRIVKVIRLESYEDTLNNLELRRTPEQQSLLDQFESLGEKGLKEQYVLRYMLDIETRGSRAMLDLEAFADPSTYTLVIKKPGSDESAECTVDLLETFNYLLGLTVQRITAPQRVLAAFSRTAEGHWQIVGGLEYNPNGSWWFRTVVGTLPDGRRALIIWRNRPSGDDSTGVEKDNLVLNAWFEREHLSDRYNPIDVIYVNGDSSLEHLRQPGDTWHVRLIEEEFQRLMFSEEGM